MYDNIRIASGLIVVSESGGSESKHHKLISELNYLP
jgi:hypothetical protein